jgi:23S rRNA maturation mini-RNase III
MLFGETFKALSEQDRLKQVKEIPLRSLAHLGDAVFELFERERELLASVT